MPKNRSQVVGKWGEDIAQEYLAQLGYSLLDHNVRTPYGEIDLIAFDRQVLVFVEVKTRTSTTFGFPEEAITAGKREHMLAAAQAFLQANPEREGDWRIDVIAIQRRAGGLPPLVAHFENAVS